MGKYDNIPPDRIRASLLRFALLVVRLERDGMLLDAVPDLQALLGDLRRMLFAHEVRDAPEVEEEEGSGAAELEDGDEDADEDVAESLRIVREAIERESDFLRELEDAASADDDGDEGRDGDDEADGEWEDEP